MAIISAVLLAVWWLPKTIIEAFLRGCMMVMEVISRWLRGVEEFGEADCILRIGMGRASADQVLSDGTMVHRSEQVGEFHLSNERMPTIGQKGRTLAWGLVSYARFMRSMHILSRYVEGHPRYKVIRAFRGETAFTFDEAELQRVARALGFDCVRVPYAPNFWGRFVEFWENFYTWMLVWTYNPASLQGKGLLRLRRYQLWMSREMLHAKHGQPSKGRRRHSHGVEARANGRQDLHLDDDLTTGIALHRVTSAKHPSNGAGRHANGTCHVGQEDTIGPEQLLGAD